MMTRYTSTQGYGKPPSNVKPLQPLRPGKKRGGQVDQRVVDDAGLTDAEWFRAHPDATHRIRALLDSDGPAPESARFVLVEKLASGVRTRSFWEPARHDGTDVVIHYDGRGAVTQAWTDAVDHWGGSDEPA